MKNILSKGLYVMSAAVAVIAVTVFIIMIDRNKESIPEGFIGKQEIAVENGKMTPEVLLAFGRLSDPQLSPSGKLILYGVSYTDITSNKSCRNLYVCNADGSGNAMITHESASISNARWCDGGKRIIFLQGGQIFTCTFKSGKEGYKIGRKVKISDIPEGISEFCLSPDESGIMYVSTVKGGVRKPSDLYEDLADADAIIADDLMYRHWDHWVKEIPHTFVSKLSLQSKGNPSVTVSSSKDILSDEKGLYELPLEPFGGLEQLSWSPCGNFIAYSCKKSEGKKYAFSTNTDIYIYDVQKGCTISRLTDSGGYDTDPRWSPDGSRICWISMERDGYEADKQRLMVANLQWIGKDSERMIPQRTSVMEATSSFKYNATAPVWNGSNEIYFASLAESIQGIFRADLDSWMNPHITRITGENDWFDFNSPFAIVSQGDTAVLYTSYCSMDFPTELVKIIATPSSSARLEVTNDTHHEVTNDVRHEAQQYNARYERITDENGHILSQLSAHKTELRKIETVDGEMMQTWVVYPPDFDENKTYPSILICLGGPQGTLSQGWSYRWNYRLMAAQGYVTVLPNRRGTTAYGQEWTEQISGDYCGLNIQDYISAAKEIKAEPYIGKMAACGASYGGYSVFYLCGVHGNVFDAFIAHAGIFNQEQMYMTTEEMWFPNWDNGGLHECCIDPLTGTKDSPVGPKGDGETFGGIRQGGSPWSNAPKAVRHYANSPHKLVKNWHTPLLVMHGGRDFRVPAEQGMAAYNSAQMMGVPSRLALFPDENHWILKPQNALCWHRIYFDWLDQWCK